RVAVAARERSGRQAQVVRRRLQLGTARRLAQRAQPRLEERLELLARVVDPLPYLLAGGRRDLAHAAQERGELTLLAQQLRADGAQRQLVGDLRELTLEPL